jgi:endonuclease G, mitochondrial
MAKNTSGSGSTIFNTSAFVILAGLAYWVFNTFTGKSKPETDAETPKTEQTKTPASQTQKEETSEPINSEAPVEVTSNVADLWLPSRTKNAELVKHQWFALSYDEDHEQAEWVAYELTREHLNENWAARPNTFRPDPLVRTESATPRDYNASGYDRGHLCAAADMAFDDKAIDETFFMSNMSPQVAAFNSGVWRELEELTRDWARKYKHLYVVTGPILTTKAMGQIGFSKVTVPSYYYKVLLTEPNGRAIAFIVPNELSTKPIMDYACSIDKVEKVTGIDFFPKILNGLNEELEGSLDKEAWPIDMKRYDLRVKDWNEK